MSQSSVCRRGPLGIAVLTTVLALACSGAAPVVAPPVAPPRVAARVLDQVPSDTPYAMSFDQTLLSATTFEVATVRAMIGVGLREALLSPEAAATASAEDRLASEVARELLPFDDAALRRVGWLPGESEVVLYGHGLIPILRVRADGRAAYAAWRRVSARANVHLQEATWDGVPYVLVPPRDKRTQLIVVAFMPHQVAVTLAMRPETLLAHLVDEAPAAEPLSSRWRRDHADPERPASAIPVMWVNPAAAAPRLRDDADLAQLDGTVPAGCRAAVADALTVVPNVSAMYWRDGDELVASYAIPLPAPMRAMFADARGVAHWLADARPGLQVAWRIPADALVAGAAQVVAPLLAAVRACDEPTDDPLAALAALPLRQLRGGVAAMEVIDGEAAVVVALEALDVGALWGWLQGALPLGPFPRPGEVRAVPLMPGQTLFAIATSREVAFSLGWPDAARLQALLASGGRPAPIVADYDKGAFAGARFLGRTMEDDGEASSPTRFTIDARGLVARSRMPLPAGLR